MAVHRNILFALTLFVAKILAGENDGEPQTCIDLLEAENLEECCESLKIFKPFDDILEECTQKDSKELNCADFTCLLNKTGLVKGDKIDENAVKKFFSDIADEYPDEIGIIDKMGVACFSEKYNNYDFVEERCPAISFYACAYINVLLECNNWNENADCKKISENAKNCKSEIQKLYLM